MDDRDPPQIIVKPAPSTLMRLRTMSQNSGVSIERIAAIALFYGLRTATVLDSVTKVIQLMKGGYARARSDGQSTKREASSAAANARSASTGTAGGTEAT